MTRRYVGDGEEEYQEVEEEAGCFDSLQPQVVLRGVEAALDQVVFGGLRKGAQDLLLSHLLKEGQLLLEPLVVTSYVEDVDLIQLDIRLMFHGCRN